MYQNERITRCERTGYPYPPRAARERRSNMDLMDYALALREERELWEQEDREALCPFYRWERRYPDGTADRKCEACKLTFPDRESRRAVVYTLCAHPQGWKRCTLAAAMEDVYERRGKAAGAAGA